MHAEIAALAHRYGLSPEAAAAFDALWADGVVASSTGVEGFDPVDLSDRGPAPSHDPSPLVAQRYEDLGPIGQGGMGEIRRVRDVQLNRTLAMKIAHPSVIARPGALARFLEEAQATAQLQHPHIVPVHDLGRLPDGRLWFTMKEVRGRTLSDVIAEVHAASGERWEASPSGWTFRRLVGAFHAVCQAVAYAHQRGVVHRDLKPANTMVGGYGEVYVLDWGLAKIVGRPDLAASAGDLDLVRTGRSADHATRMGQVAGTPAYMPPEQARGEVHRIDARSDVYALGGMLYEILAGRAPYQGGARAVLDEVLRQGPPPVGSRTRLPLPDELVRTCERAMARDPDERFPTATVLADEVQAWLDGARRRDQALEVTARALGCVTDAESLVARAAALRAESEAALRGLAGWEPEEAKAPGWALAAEADAAEQAARLKQLEVDETLRAALQIAPDLPEAHAALARRYQDRHRAAEAARDRRAQSEAATLLDAHASALPAADPLRLDVAAYLKGDGALTLVTDPPGAEVALYRCVERNRRLVEVFERSLGQTPLRATPLPMGSYVCVLRRPGHAEVRYPVEVTRRGHWDGVAPGEHGPRPVWLPPEGWLGPDEVYVPAGWFRAGGVAAAASFPGMRLWCDALVLHRFPVTNAQYVAFLDDLVAHGREEEALRHAPRERAGSDAEPGALIYGYEGGRFGLRPDADGDVWQPDWPVIQVDWHGGRAYLAWLAERTGRPWRLPGELEWEKAARGVDARIYPWGDFSDASWCRTYDSARGREHGDYGPCGVDTCPVDVSVYGLRGLGGNVQDWCADRFDAPPSTSEQRVTWSEPDPTARAPRTVRGGSWVAYAGYGRSANRLRYEPSNRAPDVGFRGLYRP